MAHDDSLASKVEDWIVAQIQGITVDATSVFEASEVQPWEGTTAGDRIDITEELFSGARDLVARVFFRSDRTEDLEEGEIRVVPQYIILIGIFNRRPDTARRGDGTTIGTNRLRDLLRYALHDRQPDDGEGGILSDGVTAVDRLSFRGTQLLINTKARCIQQSIVEAYEVPAA
jgi:hypothetical protein